MRYLGLITIAAAILSFGLTLAAAPPPAEAGKACKRLRLSSPCIKRSDIKPGHVNGSHVANGSLTGVDIANSSVTGADIRDGTVTGLDIANGSVTGVDISDGSVSGADIANSSVTGTDIVSSSVPATDLSNEAGVDNRDDNAAELITGADEVVNFVTLSAPSSGRVVLLASAWANSGNIFATTVRCSLTSGTTLTSQTVEHTLAPFERVNMTITNWFAVGAGTTTWRMVCDNSGNLPFITINDVAMSAMFFPTVY